MSDLIWLALTDVSVKSMKKMMTETMTSLNDLSIHDTSLLIIAYTVLALSTKRSLPLAAFFMSVLLIELALFDMVKGYQLYLMVFVIYSYVITRDYMLFKQRFACGIILILTVIFSYDSFMYGVGGYFGECKTIIWHNIPNLAICAHILFIASFIDARRINNNVRLFIASLVRFSRNYAYIVLI